MAQRQRVGFQTQRLGVQIPLGSFTLFFFCFFFYLLDSTLCAIGMQTDLAAGLTASRAPLAERSAVNRQVLGSIPSGGVRVIFLVHG